MVCLIPQYYYIVTDYVVDFGIAPILPIFTGNHKLETIPDDCPHPYNQPCDVDAATVFLLFDHHSVSGLRPHQISD